MGPAKHAFSSCSPDQSLLHVTWNAVNTYPDTWVDPKSRSPLRCRHLHHVGVLGPRIGGSTFWIPPKFWVTGPDSHEIEGDAALQTKVPKGPWDLAQCVDEASEGACLLTNSELHGLSKPKQACKATGYVAGGTPCENVYSSAGVLSEH